jgi:polyhydroxybutyrate depolymerase
MIHGAGGTSAWTMDETGWGMKGDKEGFLAVFPDGIAVVPSRPPKFMTNPQLWNDGSGRGEIGKQNNDDIGFLSAMLDDLEKRFAIDVRRFFVTGFSNGASMTFRVGAELSQRVAAIAPIAGHCWLKDPLPARPIPTLFMIGDQDPLVPLLGGEIQSPWTGKIEKMPAIQETLEKWAKAIDCSLIPQILKKETASEMSHEEPAKTGGELLVYKIHGLGHHWPGGKAGLTKRIGGEPSNAIKATDVIWDFFVNHPLR